MLKIWQLRFDQWRKDTHFHVRWWCWYFCLLFDLNWLYLGWILCCQTLCTLDLCLGWVFAWCLLWFSMWFQEPLRRCSVADSLPAVVGFLWHRCISVQACTSPGRRATWGAGQILLCAEALHQPHHQTEVSYLPGCFCDFFFKMKWLWKVCAACLFWCTGMERETSQILCLQMCWWGKAQRASRDQTISGKLFTSN